MIIQKRELVLTVAITIITLLLSLLVIRWMAPTLLGIPEDRLLVTAADKVPPYYENIFSRKDIFSNEFILPDPFVKSRARQLYPNTGAIGPNDILGFRNEHVPNITDLLIIGDSQTYGNNALIWENWPHVLKNHLKTNVRVYSMATGGWGAIQYYYAFLKGVIFRPKTVLIALYSGNDPLETYSMAFSTELGREFVPGSKLDLDDLPGINIEGGSSGHWPVTFRDGIQTVFTPDHRNRSNLQHEAVDVAWEIIRDVMIRMSQVAKDEGIRFYYTIIPTKEYVYREKVRMEGINPPELYQNLVDNEGGRIAWLTGQLSAVNNIGYLNVIDALTSASLQSQQLYSTGSNGHPFAAGYRVIGSEISKSIVVEKRSSPDGLYLLTMLDKSKRVIYVADGKFWINDSDADGLSREHVMQLPKLGPRKLDDLVFAGYKN